MILLTFSHLCSLKLITDSLFDFIIQYVLFRYYMKGVRL